MGEEAEDVLNSTNITTEERKVFDEVVKAFDFFFQIRVNIILERAEFNRCYQKEGEKADEYIAALYNLVKTCKYGELQEEMLRDRLVVGIRDSTLSEKLQMNPELTLDIAKQETRLKEAVQDSRRSCMEMHRQHCKL